MTKKLKTTFYTTWDYEKEDNYCWWNFTPIPSIGISSWGTDMSISFYWLFFTATLNIYVQQSITFREHKDD